MLSVFENLPPLSCLSDKEKVLYTREYEFKFSSIINSICIVNKNYTCQISNNIFGTFHIHIFRTPTE